MSRPVIARILVTGIACACASSALVFAGQTGGRDRAKPAATKTGAAVPRLADGHPDLSGVWWAGGDIGAAGGRGPVGRAGGAGPGATPPQTFASLYTPEAAQQAKKLADKDDPTLRCIPTAFGTLSVSLWDVGAVGQIVATPAMVVMLSETYHGFRLVPTDGRPHRDDQPPAYRGESVGHWEGDTFVVDTTNFTDNTWITAEGRVSPHSDALHIVERYRRLDANTLEIDATLEDPRMLKAPWHAPTQRLVLAPFDRILSLNCSGLETQALIDGAATQGK
jgi:hypothetical protein